MRWWMYLSVFFAGIFLTNFIPHFVQGVSGNAFPTPFATPPGKGLSAPVVNVLWAHINLIVGYTLVRVGGLMRGNITLLLVFFAGAILMSVRLAMVLSQKMSM